MFLHYIITTGENPKLMFLAKDLNDNILLGKDSRPNRPIGNISKRKPISFSENVKLARRFHSIDSAAAKKLVDKIPNGYVHGWVEAPSKATEVRIKKFEQQYNGVVYMAKRYSFITIPFIAEANGYRECLGVMIFDIEHRVVDSLYIDGKYGVDEHGNKITILNDDNNILYSQINNWLDKRFKGVLRF